MRKGLMFWLVFSASLVLFSCHEATPQSQSDPVDDKQLKESLEKANRYLANEEEEDIQNYIARHQLDMVATGSGVRYQVISEGEGDTIQQGQTVTMDYVLYNIRGEVIYSSETEGPKTFVVGTGGVPSGLDEAMRHLHQGDVAKVIVPSHLGYGLPGDQKSIPPRATLIYSLRITSVR